jgi:hypothetical protein
MEVYPRVLHYISSGHRLGSSRIIFRVVPLYPCPCDAAAAVGEAVPLGFRAMYPRFMAD